MGVRHEQIVTADARDALVIGRAAVDGAELAEHIVIADLKIGALAAVLLILRIAADRGELEDAVVLAHARRPVDDRMRPNSAARADDNIRINDRVGANAHVRRKLRLRGDDRAWVNGRILAQIDGLAAGGPAHLPASGVTMTSACATSFSPTRATVEKRQMPLKLRSNCAFKSS